MALRMSREEALAAVGSADLSTRLAAARSLARLAEPADAEVLRALRRSESVPWIRRALDRAISNATIRSAAPGELVDAPRREADDDDGRSEAIYASAVQEVSEQLVHELRKVLGRVRYFAEREVVAEPSRTVEHLVRMQDFLDGVETLGSAAGVPADVSLDLADLLRQEVDGLEAIRGAIAIELVGPSPSIVSGDPALLRMATSNGLKNAVEASRLGHSDAPVVVTWGTTDVEHWVAILDRGPGLPELRDSLFDIGETTKRGHSGLGLAISRRAARSLGGDAILQNDDDGTTRFEVRWPRSLNA